MNKEELEDLVEEAHGIICNVDCGRIDNQSKVWIEASKKFTKKFQKMCSDIVEVNEKVKFIKKNKIKILHCLSET